MSESFPTRDGEEDYPPLTVEQQNVVLRYRVLRDMAIEIGLGLKAEELRQKMDADFEAGVRQIMETDKLYPEDPGQSE